MGLVEIALFGSHLWLLHYVIEKALTTAFIFTISTRKWIGKSSFCKLYGFFLYLLYFEAIFGNLNMLCMEKT